MRGPALAPLEGLYNRLYTPNILWRTATDVKFVVVERTVESAGLTLFAGPRRGRAFSGLAFDVLESA